LRPQQRETMRNANLVVLLAERSFAVVLHHLGEDEVGEGAPARDQDVIDLGVRAEI